MTEDPILLPDGTPVTGCREYDALPRAVKDMHPYESWLWLSADAKASLSQTETEPEF